MNIQEEYARLCALAASKEGWQEVEDLWMAAMNYERSGSGWIKKEASSGDGDSVSGFAVDVKTWKYKMGDKGRDHFLPRLELIKELARAEERLFVEVEQRVIDGRAAHLEGWDFPLIQLSGMWIIQDEELLQKAESKILELNIGLPTAGLVKKSAQLK